MIRYAEDAVMFLLCGVLALAVFSGLFFAAKGATAKGAPIPTPCAPVAVTHHNPGQLQIEPAETRRAAFAACVNQIDPQAANLSTLIQRCHGGIHVTD